MIYTSLYLLAAEDTGSDYLSQQQDGPNEEESKDSKHKIDGRREAVTSFKACLNVITIITSGGGEFFLNILPRLVITKKYIENNKFNISSNML